MSIEELQKKHDHFVERVRRMRGWQREWEKYHVGSDKEVKKRLEREIDNLISEEVRINKSKQKELF